MVYRKKKSHTSKKLRKQSKNRTRIITMKGKIYLIPSTLGSKEANHVLPPELATIVKSIRFFLVENLRSARRFLKQLDKQIVIDDLDFHILNKHSTAQEIQSMLKPADDGETIGVISEAGCPAIADPGSRLIRLAHQKNIEIMPLVGPSSIILALMASGLNGQQFAFHGYLPIKKNERTHKIKSLERLSKHEKQTEIFMETPYRNEQLFNDILHNCQSQSWLCVAADLTLPNQFIKTKQICEWKKLPKPSLHKRPAIFLLLSE